MKPAAHAGMFQSSKEYSSLLFLSWFCTDFIFNKIDAILCENMQHSAAFSFPSLKMGLLDLFGGALGSARDYSDLKKGSWQVGSRFRVRLQGLRLFYFFPDLSRGALGSARDCLDLSKTVGFWVV